MILNVHYIGIFSRHHFSKKNFAGNREKERFTLETGRAKNVRKRTHAREKTERDDAPRREISPPCHAKGAVGGRITARGLTFPWALSINATRLG